MPLVLARWLGQNLVLQTEAVVEAVAEAVAEEVVEVVELVQDQGPHHQHAVRAPVMATA